MAKLYLSNDAILRLLKTDEEEDRFGAPDQFDIVIDFDPETNNELINQLDTDWNSFAVIDGRLYREGNVIVINPGGADYLPPEDRKLILAIAKNRKIELLLLPNWASWTPMEAESQVTGMVLSGQSKEQVNSWIDANVTGATAAAILASVKVALKLLAGAIIDLRTVAAVEAKCIMFLRDIVKP